MTLCTAALVAVARSLNASTDTGTDQVDMAARWCIPGTGQFDNRDSDDLPERAERRGSLSAPAP